jgi:cell division protease FtsH
LQKSREYSEETAREIDVAVRDIVKGAYDKAVGILSREKAALERWAQKLLEKETLVEAELDELRGSIGAAASASASARQPDRPIPAH